MFLNGLKIFAKITKDFISRNPNPYKISKEDHENLKKQHDAFMKKFYITLYDLGVDVAQLDM